MGIKAELRTKHALFIDGKQVTDYKWDKIDFGNISKGIVVYSNNEFEIYDNKTGKKKFEMKASDFLLHPSEGYVEVVSESKDMAIYTYDGILIVPWMEGKIYTTPRKYVWRIEKEKDSGYWITETCQFIKASEFYVTKSGQFEFLVDGKWKLFILVCGKYLAIDEISASN